MRRAPIATMIFFGAIALFWATVATVMAASVAAAVPSTAVFTAVVLACAAGSGVVAGDEEPLRARIFAAIASIGVVPALTCCAMIGVESEAHTTCGLASLGLILLAMVGGLRGALAVPSPYRDDGRSHDPEIFPASKDELRRATNDRSLALCAYALAAAVLSAAPLLAAAFVGVAF